MKVGVCAGEWYPVYDIVDEPDEIQINLPRIGVVFHKILMSIFSKWQGHLQNLREIEEEK